MDLRLELRSSSCGQGMERAPIRGGAREEEQHGVMGAFARHKRPFERKQEGTDTAVHVIKYAQISIPPATSLLLFCIFAQQLLISGRDTYDTILAVYANRALEL